MVNLNPEICHRLRDARKSAKLSQIEVAKEIGCRQSALSMFEQGDGTKLNEGAVRKLAAKFGVDIAEKPGEGAGRAEHPKSACRSAGGAGYCPDPRCPTNHAYTVDGKTLYRPDRLAADPVGGRFCAMCGEVLVKACPNCGAQVHDGGFCSICGDPYVAVGAISSP